MTTSYMNYNICYSTSSSVFVHLLVRFQRLWGKNKQILTRLRGLRDCEGWSFSPSELVFACGLCWLFCFMLWGLLSVSMKPPVLLLCALLFCQSWAFEFVIDGEWEDEMVRWKVTNLLCVYPKTVEKWSFSLYLFVSRVLWFSTISLGDTG